MKHNTILFSRSHEHAYDKEFEAQMSHVTQMTLCLVKDAQKRLYLASLEDESLDRLKRINLQKQIDASNEGTSEYNIVIDELENVTSKDQLILQIEKSTFFEFKDTNEEFMNDYNELMNFVKNDLIF
jgi:hypothetical protein